VSEGFGNTAWSTSTGFCSSVSGAAWSRSWSPTFSASASTGGFSVGSGAEGPSFGASSSPFCTWVISPSVTSSTGSDSTSATSKDSGARSVSMPQVSTTACKTPDVTRPTLMMD
jgi:hypothetical protein